MIEHRLIERAIELMKAEKERVEAGGELDTLFVDKVVDFIRVYADRTHHGKEEDILFEDLEGKPMSDDEARLMAELVEEHKLGRKLTGELVAAKEAYMAGDVSQTATVLARFQELIDFYPQHIAKEDDHFFPDTERHYSKEELDKMLADFYDFDMQMIHEKYKNDVSSWEGERPHRR
jgi:hemerythrin-like domain-containing protein